MQVRPKVQSIHFQNRIRLPNPITFTPINSPDLLTLARVRRYLLDRMLSGHLEPGDRVVLPQIARKLELSVTPVRGALNQLSYSGVVDYRDKYGFRLSAPSVAEARRLYHAVVALETEALRESGLGKKLVVDLRHLNQVLAKAADAPARFRADLAWHAVLGGYFADTALAHLLEDMKVRLYLFERAYFQDAARLDEAVAQHEAIAQALQRGEVDMAVVALRQNWLAIEPHLDALEVRAAKN